LQESRSLPHERNILCTSVFLPKIKTPAMSTASQKEGPVVEPAQNGHSHESALPNGTSSAAPAVTPTQSGKPHEEHQYLDLVREILDNGEHRPDR
jgi:hypothetical protein